MLDCLARARTTLSALVASALLPACFTSPYDGQVVGENAPFTVNGYAETPNAVVAIEVRNNTTGAWEEIGRATSSASPSYPAGSLTPNSPSLYWFGTQVRVVDPARPLTWNRWGSSYWTQLRMRNLSTGQPLYGGDADSIGCFFNAPLASSDFYDLGYSCGWDSTEIAIVSAIP